MQTIEAMETDDGLSTERAMVQLLARWGASDGTVEQLDAAINALIDIFGNSLKRNFGFVGKGITSTLRNAACS